MDWWCWNNNCIFVYNPDQKDLDGDGTGDVCKPIDQCPEIPEDLDGNNDLDGCPDADIMSQQDVDQANQQSIPYKLPSPGDGPGTYVNKGPLCLLLDYAADLMPGDKIMTAITDVNTHDIIYASSNEVDY